MSRFERTLLVLSTAASVTTLTMMVFGAKKMQHEIEEVKAKSNKSLGKLKAALADLEI